MSLLAKSGYTIETRPWSNQTYYWNNTLQRAQLEPPYFEILGLDADKFRDHSRELVFRKYRERLNEISENYGSNGCVDEESKRLLVDAYKCLSDIGKRARYEQAICSEHGRKMQIGLVTEHLARASRTFPGEIIIDEAEVQES